MTSKSFLPLLAVIFTVGSAAAADVGVLVRFGLKGQQAAAWDGSLALSSGKVVSLEGWRFEDTDAVVGLDSWKAHTRPLTQRNARGNNPQKLGMRQRQQQQQAQVPIADNGVLAQLTGVDDATTISIKLAQGEVTFKLGDLKLGEALSELDGTVAVHRVSATSPLTPSDNSDYDYPSIAMDKKGGTWVAYTAFTPGLDRAQRARPLETAPESFDELAKPTGGDQVWLSHRAAGSEAWDKAITVSSPGADIMRCAVAMNQEKPWVVWSEGEQGKFRVVAMQPMDKESPLFVLSGKGGNALSPAATTDAKGALWVAWQQETENSFRIYARHGSGELQEPVLVSEGLKRNCWSPAIAASADGKVAIAWDTYEKGDYDIYVREFDAQGQPGPVRAVANTPKYESRPTLTYDTQGRLWIAWEESGPKWGKDWGHYQQDPKNGIGLYRNRHIGLIILDNGAWKEPAESQDSAMPGHYTAKGWQKTPLASLRNDANSVNGGGFANGENQAPRRGAGQGKKQGKAGEETAPIGPQIFDNLPRLCADKAGRVWLLCRTKEGEFHTPLGSVWMDQASYYEGNKWHGPVLIPHSDDLMFNMPAVVGLENGIRLAHSTDHRQDRLNIWKENRIAARKGGNDTLAAKLDPFINGIYVSELTLSEKAEPLVLKDAEHTPKADAQPAEYTTKEIADIKAVHDYRVTVNGNSLRILRGEFHRHTEISGDGGGDGPLEDLWRYALDVAAMDWIGCGDHDNGGGREYTWWLTQKTTDAYHVPGSFDPLFTYERSVPYPEGHRNVIFTTRGIRTLPRLPISDALDPKSAPDTQMLYRYLHHFNGICASHTSATNMGTDWRDNDAEVEPFVEIYQGARQNYERPGAPRAPSKDDAVGGWEAKGMINLALLKGYRLAFESSSDHGSTHISYACVYAKDASRQGIFDAMKLRHTYAATDNIIADVRTQVGNTEHMMGEEFTTKETPNFNVKLIGTQPFAKVTVIKDDVEVQVTEPKTKEVTFTWKDEHPENGKASYYYLRGEQEDGELVWSSPMWIKYAP